MDPNAALQQLRAQADAILSGGGNADTMAELFQALDEWLSNGGFPPQAWQVQDTWR